MGVVAAIPAADVVVPGPDRVPVPDTALLFVVTPPKLPALVPVVGRLLFGMPEVEGFVPTTVLAVEPGLDPGFDPGFDPVIVELIP